MRTRLVLGALVAALAGCGGVDYVAQGACGQIDILMRTRDIGDVLRDPEVPARTRSLLAEVAAIKRFGERQGLTPTSSYARTPTSAAPPRCGS
jgi:predicted aminopeptidase